jgi:glyoxylase-like metal-dependent hydrolase (beta-lactamase superfamily II)
LLEDGELVEAGSLRFKVISTPGHTSACVCYAFDDALFAGDILFMPDMGTGRCDFPAGSAEQLYDSITQRIYTLPDQTRIFVGHDYQPGGRPLAYRTNSLSDLKIPINVIGTPSSSQLPPRRSTRCTETLGSFPSRRIATTLKPWL